MSTGLFVALLKGINVGGSGLLSMKDLSGFCSGFCSGLGFETVRTYIQSGNVVFASTLTERQIASSLEKNPSLQKGQADSRNGANTPRDEPRTQEQSLQR